jgi:hypothetical protein
MTSSWASAGLALTLLVPASPCRAQDRPVREFGVAAVGAAADPALGILGVTASLRPGYRTRIGVLAGGGLRGDAAAARVELAGHFLLSPRSSGTGLYAGGGIAGVFSDGESLGYLVLLIGIEARPGSGNGWFLEGGVGGGARVAVGWRWRSRG